MELSRRISISSDAQFWMYLARVSLFDNSQSVGVEAADDR